MRITFSPQRRDDALVVVKSGDVLTINGAVFDFWALPEGATLPREAITCDLIAGDVERVDGVLVVPLILPHGAEPSPAVAFPAPLDDVPDGFVHVPRDPVIAVLSRSTSEPPPESEEGAAYIVPDVAGGAWQGNAGHIAIRSDGWMFSPATPGLAVWIADEDAVYVFDGAQWVAG